MVPDELVIGILFLFQTGIGLLGNSFHLYLCILAFFTKHSQRPTDLILNHLTIANSLVLLSRGISQILAALSMKYFLGDVECKLSFYIHRVARGISLCTTCLLSGFQAITISPSNSRWIQLKLKAPKFIKSSCVLCWIIHLLINIIMPIRVIRSRKSTNITEKNFGLCSVRVSDSFFSSLYAFLFSFLDLLCLGPTGWASVSIVLLLQRHKRRVQYIHHTSPSSRASPEVTATHTVLLLVSSFVFFYSLCSVFPLYTTLFNNPSLHLVNISTFLTACFPAFCPFVLIICHIRIFRNYEVSCGKAKISKVFF